MSYYKIKYEFMGQDSAGLRGGEVCSTSTSSEPVPQVATSRRDFPSAHREVGVGGAAATATVERS